MIPPWCSWIATRRDDTSVVFWISTRRDDTSVVHLYSHQAWWYLRGVPGYPPGVMIPPAAYSTRSRQRGKGQTHQCGGAVVLASLSPKDKNLKRNTLNINYFISPSRLCRATQVCDRVENCARKDTDNHLKHKKLVGKIYNSKKDLLSAILYTKT